MTPGAEVVVASPITASVVPAIAAMEDPALRNLWITQAYHEWGVALARLMGEAGVSWCAFGTWASKSAGQTIRGDELPEGLRNVLADCDPESRARRRAQRVNGALHRLRLVERLEDTHLAAVADYVAEDVSAKVAAGNVLVFAELGPVLAGLVAAFDADPRPAESAGPALIAGLLDANPPPDGDRAGLELALGAWWDAIYETDPVVQAQRVLVGNIAAVLHEQRRLQDAVAGALDASINDGFDVVMHDLIRSVVAHGAVHRLLDWGLRHLSKELARGWRDVATNEMTTLATSDELLHLGRDLPPLRGVAVPVSLAHLTDADAVRLWSAWNRADPDLNGTAAGDWADIEDRMNYIVNLFRSRQQHPALLDPPYSPAQLTAMTNGSLPDPPL